MTSPQNQEPEFVKAMQKILQESKDDPTTMATKYYIILEGMKSNGKENTPAFYYISRAMEFTINQHALDVDQQLNPSAGGAVGESSSSKFTCAIDNYGKPLVHHESPSSLETKPGHLQEGDDLATGDKSNENDGKRIINSIEKVDCSSGSSNF